MKRSLRMLLSAVLLAGLATTSSLAAEPSPKDGMLMRTWMAPVFPSALKSAGLGVDVRALKKLATGTPFEAIVGKALAAEADRKADAAAKQKAWCQTLQTAARLPKELSAVLTPACQAARARLVTAQYRTIAVHTGYAELERWLASPMGALPKEKATVAKAYIKAFSDFRAHPLVKDAVKLASALGRNKPHAMESARDMAEQACDKADGLACVIAGIILEEGAEKKPAFAKMALKRYQQACTIGNDLGCMHQAIWSYRTKDEAKAQQLLRSACSRRHGASCHVLAQIHRHGIGTVRSHEDARRYAKAGCTAGDGDACATVGLQLLKSRRPDAAAAKAHYEKACAWGTARGCAGLGYLSQFGKATKRDPRGALRAYTQACDAGWAVACDNAARMQEAGEGTRPNMPRALALWGRSCSLGWGLACSRLGDLAQAGGKPLTQAYPTMAYSMQMRGCLEGHGSACVKLGKHFQLGLGTKTNYRRALDLYENACKGVPSVGMKLFPQAAMTISKTVREALTMLVARAAVNPMDGDGCVELAGIYDSGSGVRRDPKKAMTLIDTACKARVGAACEAQGRYYKQGIGTSVDLKKAMAAYDKGCTLKQWSACTKVGFHHMLGLGTPKDGGKALPFLQRACDAKQQDACSHIATIHFTGNGVAKDPKKGMALYGKACTAGHAVACANLGFNHLTGVGTKKNEGQALKFFKKGCALKHRFSCAEVAKLTKK